MLAGSVGTSCLTRQAINAAMKNAPTMPSDLCRLKKKARSGVFLGMSTMVQPLASKAMISSATIQCRITALRG